MKGFDLNRTVASRMSDLIREEPDDRSGWFVSRGRGINPTSPSPVQKCRLSGGM